MNRTTLVKLAGASLLLVPQLASAHHLDETMNPFAGGVSMPIHGPDHIIAMIAVGIWAVLFLNKSRWTIPAAFLGLMMVGMVFGAGSGHVSSLIESGVLLSLCAIGLLIALVAKLPVWALGTISGFFALFHGYACGAPLPPSWSPTVFGLGLFLGTAGAIALGFGIGHLIRIGFGNLGLRIAGALVAGTGIYLWASAAA